MASKRPKNPVSESITPPAVGELVKSAVLKAMRKEALSRAEQRALRKYEKEKEERLRWKYYHTIPKKHWQKMSGRQHKVLDEQAIRHGIPVGEAVISLPLVVTALHDFLRANKAKLSAEEDPLMQGGPSGSPALERYREERAAMARLDRLARERQLLPRHASRVALGRIAALIRSGCESLQRQYGPQAAAAIHESLDEAEREIERFFGAEGEEQNDDGLGANRTELPADPQDPA